MKVIKSEKLKNEPTDGSMSFQLSYFSKYCRQLYLMLSAFCGLQHQMKRFCWTGLQLGC